MLEELRRSNAKHLVVLSVEGEPVPADLAELWGSGFRTHLTIVSSSPQAKTALRDWLDRTEGVAATSLLSLEPSAAVEDFLERYSRFTQSTVLSFACAIATAH